MNLYSKLPAGQYSGKLIELYAIEPLDSPMKTQRIPFGWNFFAREIIGGRL